MKSLNYLNWTLNNSQKQQTKKGNKTMPLMIHVTKADLLKGQMLPPGWKKAEVQAVYAKPSKDQESVNYWIVFAFLDDPDGRTIEHNFNSKALGISLQNFLAACKGMPLAEFMTAFPKSADIDLESTIGKQLHVKTKNEIFEGRPVNKIEDFASFDKVPF